jgi:hypothetical protein
VGPCRRIGVDDVDAWSLPASTGTAGDDDDKRPFARPRGNT